MRTLLTLSLFLLVPSFTNAAPTINSTSGTVEDGLEITLNGSSFGSHALDFDFLGGADGIIENSTAGTIPTDSGGWYFHDPAGFEPEVTTAQVHSGDKSLYHLTDGSHYNSALRYDYGSYVTTNNTVYVTWWTRPNWSTVGQWKMFRWKQDNDISDGAPESCLFNWTTVQGSQWTSRPGPGLEAPGEDTWIGNAMITLENVWYRMEITMELSSSLGVSDGRFTMGVYVPGSTRGSSSEGGIRTLNSGSTGYRWAIWQNYRGNGMSGFYNYGDDYYIQVGSEARVELCAESSWSSRRHCEIQPATDWNESSIKIKVNQGSFTDSQTVYLYVIDDAGLVSDSELIVMGSETGSNEIMGPLTVSSENSRYFADNEGTPVYLTGSHTWNNFQDINDESDPISDFDFPGYLTWLNDKGHNFIRLWVWENSHDMLFLSRNDILVYPSIYQRTGPGTANDGGLKFDLTTFNQDYFDQLRTRVQQAQSSGIYVSIMLFDGWSVAGDKGGTALGNVWEHHPFNTDNNINGINMSYMFQQLQIFKRLTLQK